ncbi:hypothetical protein FACS1894206_07570 [Deltaproteobacteria bacterium]|nr:hypothetical protein FACS1894206_07570 [Deltaproteobacteria bacterium]
MKERKNTAAVCVSREQSFPAAFLPLRNMLYAGKGFSSSEQFPAMPEPSEIIQYISELQRNIVSLEQKNKELAALAEQLQKQLGKCAAALKVSRDKELQFAALARTDCLTGLANRQAFFQMATRELERIRRAGGSACLAMIDIDYFKEVNDSLGHMEGDKVLHFLAKVLVKNIRPYDIAGRFGGDEFVLLFPDTSTDMAHIVLERIRAAVEKAELSAGEGNPKVTASIGVAEIPVHYAQSDSAFDSAVARADEALYKAKTWSRNQICVAHGSPPPPLPPLVKPLPFRV